MRRDRRRRRSSAPLLLLVALSVLATSCFQTQVGLEVESDGSGQLVVDVVPSPALLTAVGGNLPALATQLQTAASAQSAAAVVEVTDTPAGQALRVELPFTEIDALSIDAGSASGGITGALLGGIVQRLQVTNTDGVWSMVAVLDLQAARGGLLTTPLAAATGLDTQPQVTFSVTLPGRVDTTNATSTSGGTATWSIDTAATAPQTLRMTNAPVAVMPVVLAVLGALALFAFLVGLFRRWRRNRVQAALHAEVQATAAATFAASPATSPWVAGLPSGFGPATPAASEQTDQGRGDAAALQPPHAPGAQPAAGWYPDPAGSAQLRWWDGERWTEHLHKPHTDSPH